MSLTEEQILFVITIDHKVKQIIRGGNDRDLFLYVQDLMTKDNKLYSMLNCSKKEFNALCEQYEGFYSIMKLLEQLAECSSKGIMPKNSEEFVANWID